MDALHQKLAVGPPCWKVEMWFDLRREMLSTAEKYSLLFGPQEKSVGEKRWEKVWLPWLMLCLAVVARTSMRWTWQFIKRWWLTWASSRGGASTSLSVWRRMSWWSRWRFWKIAWRTRWSWPSKVFKCFQLHILNISSQCSSRFRTSALHVLADLFSTFIPQETKDAFEVSGVCNPFSCFDVKLLAAPSVPIRASAVKEIISHSSSRSRVPSLLSSGSCWVGTAEPKCVWGQFMFIYIGVSDDKWLQKSKNHLGSVRAKTRMLWFENLLV